MADEESEIRRMAEIADAINDAEARNPAILTLRVWRPDMDDSKRKWPGNIKAPTAQKLLQPLIE